MSWCPANVGIESSGRKTQWKGSRQQAPSRTCQIRVVTRIDEVMGERLIHVVGQFKLGDGDDRIVLAHEISEESVETELALVRIALVGLVLIYDILRPRLARVGIQYLVEARVPLGVVQEVDELGDGHQSAFAIPVSPDDPLEYLLHVRSLSERLVKVEKVLELEL